MAFAMDDYIDVAERIREFRDKHPAGSLQQHSIELTEFAGKPWVIYTAAAYRTPDDPRPGHGTAWEPVPGPTKFTRDSEIQNAETAAWGRAIVAVLAADTKKIASRQEVQNRAEPKKSDRLTVASAEDAIAAAETQATLVAIADHIKAKVAEGLIDNADRTHLLDSWQARSEELDA